MLACFSLGEQTRRQKNLFAQFLTIIWERDTREWAANAQRPTRWSFELVCRPEAQFLTIIWERDTRECGLRTLNGPLAGDSSLYVARKRNS